MKVFIQIRRNSGNKMIMVDYFSDQDYNQIIKRLNDNGDNFDIIQSQDRIIDLTLNEMLTEKNLY